MNWFLLALKRYADFSGRSRRSEYWYFQLFSTIALILTLLIASLIVSVTESGVGMLLVAIYAIGVLIPSLSVTIRRLHDTGRSGWWLLAGMIPLVGPIMLLVFYCEDSKYGPNLSLIHI